MFKLLGFIPTFFYFSPFFSWLITFLLYATGTFWAYHSGFLAAMIAADVTGICLAITLITPLVSLYTGWIAFKVQFDKMDSSNSAYLATELALPNEYRSMITLLGVLGTAIGLLMMMTNLGTVLQSATAGADLLPVMGKIAAGVGVALWVTVVSLVAAIAIWIQTFIIELSFEKMKLIFNRGF